MNRQSLPTRVAIKRELLRAADALERRAGLDGRLHDIATWTEGHREAAELLRKRAERIVR